MMDEVGCVYQGEPLPPGGTSSLRAAHPDKIKLPL